MFRMSGEETPGGRYLRAISFSDQSQDKVVDDRHKVKMVKRKRRWGRSHKSALGNTIPAG
jgi:hypothetical protein